MSSCFGEEYAKDYEKKGPAGDDPGRALHNKTAAEGGSRCFVKNRRISP
jgi:hypothetical protein